MATTTTMPVFWPARARIALGEERFQQALTDPASLDLLTWNVFATLETHHDEGWLAYRLQMFGGPDVTTPVRLQLWTGRDAEPRLLPSRGHRERTAARSAAAGLPADALAVFAEPVEVPVRIESPAVLSLVDVMDATYPRGAGGRDRLLELVDAGIDHARRLDKELAVAVVYRSGTAGAAELSRRLSTLRSRDGLAQALPHRDSVDGVSLREVPWQQLIRVWEAEVDHLDLPTSPKPFLRHLTHLGLR